MKTVTVYESKSNRHSPDLLNPLSGWDVFPPFVTGRIAPGGGFSTFNKSVGGV